MGFQNRIRNGNVLYSGNIAFLSCTRDTDPSMKNLPETGEKQKGLLANELRALYHSTIVSVSPAVLEALYALPRREQQGPYLLVQDP